MTLRMLCECNNSCQLTDGADLEKASGGATSLTFHSNLRRRLLRCCASYCCAMLVKQRKVWHSRRARNPQVCPEAEFRFCEVSESWINRNTQWLYSAIKICRYIVSLKLY
ncbi:uncharacterized protein LOC143905818 [Temnothorax americanus]|uniref:uncharacterized protein LOC143905818 n=1 Tax=Temnothorax americanus TaxID=1964332 RepID=UPI004067653E